MCSWRAKHLQTHYLACTWSVAGITNTCKRELRIQYQEGRGFLPATLGRSLQTRMWAPERPAPSQA